MSEGQHLEWKASWYDDHLKSVCAFANADGGALEIGRDDEGAVVGIGARERRRLLEELPNKLRDLLGIVAAMDVEEADGVHYLRIVVEPYPVAISYRGVYYQRSGSTNQMLRGPALDRFLLGKTGRCWDGMPDPRAELDDLDPAAIAGFRKRAGKEGRLSGNALDEDDAGLLEKLRLTDGDYLTKAAVLLFHHDPERFVAGAHVKVGYFANEWDVRFHDVMSGDLFTQVDKTMGSPSLQVSESRHQLRRDISSRALPGAQARATGGAPECGRAPGLRGSRTHPDSSTRRPPSDLQSGFHSRGAGRWRS